MRIELQRRINRHRACIDRAGEFLLEEIHPLQRPFGITPRTGIDVPRADRKGHPSRFSRVMPWCATLLAVLLHTPTAWSATHPATTTPTAAPTSTSPAPATAQDPEGVVFNPATGSYTVHHVPTRSLEVVLKSLADWHHQVLADDSTADFTAEDGILSMECSACGLTRPSAIDIAQIDPNSIMAYEAGAWHLGVRSKDGTQDFFGTLRGEIGPEPHDPTRVSDDRRAALTALVDIYDLAYLTQNPSVSATPAKGAAAPPAKSSPQTTSAMEVSPSDTATTLPNAHPSKPAPTSLAALAASGDIEAIQAQQRAKANPRDVAHALETAYGVRARRQMLDGQVDAALQTLSAGRQSFGKSAPLRDLEAHYVVVGDAYDRLRLAVKLDVSEIRDYLQQIRKLEPTDATSIEEMLARTLSNRIADQRVAGRKVIVDALLASGEDLFPAWADRLSQGTAGMLPKAGVEVGSTEAPGSH